MLPQSMDFDDEVLKALKDVIKTEYKEPAQIKRLYPAFDDDMCETLLQIASMVRQANSTDTSLPGYLFIP